MECGIYLFLMAIIIGSIVIGNAPNLLGQGFRAITSSISDRGAFASGCIGGSSSTLVSILVLDRFVPSAGDFVCISVIFVAGAISGALAGAIWAVIMDRYVRTGANYGAVGGVVAAPISLFVYAFLAMWFFGG